MKFKYIDKRNFQWLVPVDFHRKEITKEVEGLLDDLNDSSEYAGLADKLLLRNKNSQGRRTWKRYYPIDIDIALVADNPKNQIQCSVIPQNRPEGLQRILIHFRVIQTHGHQIDFKIPLQSLLKGWGNANDGWQIYVHTLTYGHVEDHENRLDINGNKVKELSYVGLTGRNWLQRLDEHTAEARNGVGYLFHSTMRGSMANKDMVYVQELFDLNLSFKDAMNLEELLVDAWSLAPKGLNMIPGGFRGCRELGKRNVLSENSLSLNEHDLLKARNESVNKVIDCELKKGNTTLNISSWWSDDDKYWGVADKRDKWLNKYQVVLIWALYGDGLSLEEIHKEVGAIDVRQVKGVITKKHYNRTLSSD